jgi:hypothetical protein
MQRVFTVISLGILAGARVVHATTNTTLDGAVTTFSSLFLLGVFLLGAAGLTTIVYTVARSRYGVIWDEALSVIKAVAVGASFVTILGWVGSSAAAPMDPRPVEVQIGIQHSIVEPEF